MAEVLCSPPSGEEPAPETVAFYRQAMLALREAGIPYLVGGAFAFQCYTGIHRATKDLDLFIRREDFEKLHKVMGQSGYTTELTFPHWLGKTWCGDDFIDFIFSSGNGIAVVDEQWFAHAPPAEVLGTRTAITPVEESIWSKAFIMERERYDGADIAHLIRATASSMQWERLLLRFARHWRVLLSHLTLFGFVYPSQRDLVPAWLMGDLIERLRAETCTPPPQDDICGGPLLSRAQYLTDIQEDGYRDPRLQPIGNMTVSEAARWTEAIREKQG